MPDVSRSDSQRSDTSLRPRVSFNRDVHVKRIVPRAQSNDGDSHLINPTVRKERIKKSKKELAEEAAQVIEQADKLNCFTHSNRFPGGPEKFYTLPSRRKEKKINYPSASLDRKATPKKPPRTFTANGKNNTSTPKIKRSVSDATNLKKARALYETDKKQLSPIIENIQREDYFQNEIDLSEKENKNNNNRIESSVTQQLKKYIDEVDRQIDEDNRKKNDQHKVEVVVIDIDNAEKIAPSNLSKLKKRFKSITNKSLVQSAKNNLQKPPEKMIHSSQKPPDKPPLTKGRTVDRMVRRLNQDAYSPPPRPKVTVVPTASVQHNNNQPFSYTRGLSPDKSPVIYAQVVTGPNAKQTVHTVYHHSDSDEGLGNEDSSLLMRKARSEKTLTHFGDEESPIRPKYRVLESSFECLDSDRFFADTTTRGRGDGMDSRRRESLSEDIDEAHRYDISARRDLLESRITKRINDVKRSDSSSPPYKHQSFESNEEYTPKSYKYTTSQQTSEKKFYKSTPDIVQYNNDWPNHRQTYHDSLRREKYQSNKPEKDRFGDSGIENDFRRDSRDNFPVFRSKTGRYYNDSEDEGFASSLLIASERQHTEDNVNLKTTRKEYDSDRAYSAEDDPYRNVERLDYKMVNNVPRERSIDDGSHFDPRIDKDCRGTTLKRGNEKKPPKPEKKSGLEKVKRLFTRDNKKKKEKPEMVREGSLRARYTEYKGSQGNLVEPSSMHHKKEETFTEHRYASRRRLSTPSPSSSPTRDLEPKRKSDNLQTSWFKSLDRLSRKKNKKEISKPSSDPPLKRSEKSLRFFGDTDQDSSDTSARPSHRISSRDRIRSQSSRELHNISEETLNNRTNNKSNNHHQQVKRSQHHHKSMTNISDGNNARSRTMTRTSMKPPMSPLTNRRPNNSSSESRTRKSRKYDISSVESSTEGDSSQQSQRSVVYLHAATVGDIPGPLHVKPNRLQPQVKTLSRSFSVLAPWKPRHAHETANIDYSQRSENGTKLRTLKRESKENLANGKGSSTLYKKKGRLPRENSRYSRDRAEDKKAKSMSVESLRSNGRLSDRTGSHDKRGGGGGGGVDISRSVSMPKDPEKSAGWFKMNKKNHHRSDYITQRL